MFLSVYILGCDGVHLLMSVSVNRTPSASVLPTRVRVDVKPTKRFLGFDSIRRRGTGVLSYELSI